jgi:hypothetical protein
MRALEQVGAGSWTESAARDLARTHKTLVAARIRCFAATANSTASVSGHPACRRSPV